MSLDNNHIGYIRTSSKGKSIKAQKERLINYTTNLYIDDGIKGTTKPTARKGFSQLLNDCNEKTIVHTTSLDRIGRDTDIIIESITLIQSTGATIHLHSKTDIKFLNTDKITPNTDITSPSFTAYIQACEIERDKINERCQKGLGGRPKINISDTQHNLIVHYLNHCISFRELQTAFKISRSSLYNKINEVKSTKPVYILST